jgi:hypothetical protein
MERGRFRDRGEAGELLASEVAIRVGLRDDAVVLALPRGGVPIAFSVAKALNAPLDVFVVRKLGVPGHEELAMGAIASGGVQVMNEQTLDWNANGASWCGGSACTAATALRSTSQDEPSSSSMTDWPPDRRCEPRSTRCGR